MASSEAVTDVESGRPDRVDAAEQRRRVGESRRLKRLLKSLDLVSLVLGWTLAYHTMVRISPTEASDRIPLLLLGVVGVTASLAIMASKRLWLARVCSVRSAELEGLGATAVIAALIVLAVSSLADYGGHDRFPLLGALYSFLLMTTCRGMYAGWLRRARRNGRFARRLVLVGANGQAHKLAGLIGRHPEMGFEIAGVCGPREDSLADDEDVPWLGNYSDAVAAVSEADANGALVVSSAMDPGEFDLILRGLLSTGCHVHVSSALSGISHERLLPLPLAREPLFYLERTTLTRSQLAVKRVTDVFLSAVLMIVALPVLAVLAGAIKLEDGGPVLFRQRRIGHRGKPFTLFKLRTMVVDAEAKLAAVKAQQNAREGGPLFKAERDPRITRVGWWLRATSLDELPQVFNVLRGDMSLVGPRPALPEEVAQFDKELQQRGRMMPGITGLWQVEGRDDPSFDSYRRLDLYYVENWSIGLDLAIICTTAGAVTRRGLRLALRRSGAS